MPCPFSESWNTCAVPWKPVVIVAGRFDFALELLDRVDRLAERDAGREIERDRHRRLLALVVDLQRPDRRHQLGHRVSGIDSRRHAVPVTPPPAVCRGIDVGLQIDFDRLDGSVWNSGLRLQDDLVVVGRRVDRRDLARAEGVVQFLAHLIDGDAVDRRLLAVDLDRHLRILDVEIGGDVEQARRAWRSCRAARARRDRASRCRSIAACTGTGSW